MNSFVVLQIIDMDLSALSNTPLFRAVRKTEIERIFQELNIQISLFKKDDVLAFQDAPCNRLIILLSGSVKGEMAAPSGKIIKVEDIYAPMPLAILFLFGEENRFPVQATACEDGSALIIPKQSVVKMLSMNETLLKNYLDISADFAARLSKKLHFMSFRSIRQKLAIYFLELSKEHESDKIIFDRPKSALAEYFGVSRPSLERELTNMQQQGLIVANKKEITIANRNQLIQLVRF